MRRKLAALKAELAGPSPAPIERLLVGPAAACWVQVSFADAAAAQARDVSVRQAGLALRRQDAAHRRYLSALAALATVRRLLPATVEQPGVAGAPSRPIEACAAPGGGPGRGATGDDPARTGAAPSVPFAADGGDREPANTRRAATRSTDHSRAI